MGSIESFGEQQLYKLLGHAVEVTFTNGKTRKGFLQWHKGYVVDGKIIRPDSVQSVQDFGETEPDAMH